MAGNTPQETAGNTPVDLERLYLKEEYFTFEVSGITFKARDLSAEELFALTQKATVDGELQQNLYAKELMKACIVEPKIDFTRELRGVAATSILSGLQDALGLTELAQKKSLTR